MNEERSEDLLNSFSLTNEQKAMYDRQLRVWGVNTQLKISKAKVLLLGSRAQTLLECAKNIVLAGCGKVVLFDDLNTGLNDTDRDRSDLKNNFLVSVEHVENLNNESTDDDNNEKKKKKNDDITQASANALQEMNPFGSVTKSTENELEDLSIEDFDVVVCCGRRNDYNKLRTLNERCREKKVAFFLAEVCSQFGYFFTDLSNEFEYVTTTSSSLNKNDTDASTKPITLKFASLHAVVENSSFVNFKPKRNCKFAPIFCALKQLEMKKSTTSTTNNKSQTIEEVRTHISTLPGGEKVNDSLTADDLELFLDTSIEMPAIAAIVGGLLANEVIKAISHAEEPTCNFFCFDVRSGKGSVEKLAC